MRVLTVTNMYPTPRRPHAGIFVHDHVASMREAGVEVDVFATDSHPTRRAYLTDVPRLRARLSAARYDLIHAHHSYSVHQTAAARPRHRPPLLLTFHEGEAHAPGWLRHAERDRLKRLVYSRRLKRLALRRCDFVVAVQDGLTRAVGYAGPGAVIPPGVDVERFRPLDREKCRRELGLPQDQPVIFFPGDPGRPEKGADLFAAALERREGPAHVVYGGAIGRTLMPAHFSAADVVVSTSRFEASPMAIKEAMACEARVVSTPVGDVAAVFQATPGCYVADADAQTLADRIDSALEFDGPPGRRDRILALELSLPQVARRYLDVYRRVAADSGASAGKRLN